jgi:hypothetical protein
MFKALIGDLFASQTQTRVNTVNCVGVMGKGIAQEFKKRYGPKRCSFPTSRGPFSVTLAEEWRLHKAKSPELGYSGTDIGFRKVAEPVARRVDPRAFVLLASDGARPAPALAWRLLTGRESSHRAGPGGSIGQSRAFRRRSAGLAQRSGRRSRPAHRAEG